MAGSYVIYCFFFKGMAVVVINFPQGNGLMSVRSCGCFPG